MTDKETEKILIRLLKELNIYNAYMYNLKYHYDAMHTKMYLNYKGNYNYMPFSGLVKIMRKSNTEDLMLTLSFPWTKTIEGLLYWRMKHIQFKDMCHQILYPKKKMNDKDALIVSIRLLKELNIYNEFMYNFNKHLELPLEDRLSVYRRYHSEVNNFIDFIKSLSKGDRGTLVIAEGFIWGKTKEGYAFWENKNVDFHNMFDKIRRYYIRKEINEWAKKHIKD